VRAPVNPASGNGSLSYFDVKNGACRDGEAIIFYSVSLFVKLPRTGEFLTGTPFDLRRRRRIAETVHCFVLELIPTIRPHLCKQEPATEPRAPAPSVKEDEWRGTSAQLRTTCTSLMPC
jgi:hypothetical protein